jgi:hypothetical protein
LSNRLNKLDKSKLLLRVAEQMAREEREQKGYKDDKARKDRRVRRGGAQGP